MAKNSIGGISDLVLCTPQHRARQLHGISGRQCTSRGPQMDRLLLSRKQILADV
jgi:hypothetical protein